MKSLSPRPENSWRMIVSDTICVWLISAGILFEMRQLFRFENPEGLIILRSILVVALILILSRRWWIMLGSAVLLAIAAFTLSIAGKWRNVWLYIRGLIIWWINKFPATSIYDTESNIELVHWLITFFVCALIFLCVRRIRFMSITALLVSVVFTAILLNGFRDSFFGLFLSAAGLLPLAVRSRYANALHHSELRMMSPRRIMAMGLAVCAVCASAARIMVPYNTSGWQIKSFEGIIDPLPDFFRQPMQFPLSLINSGLQPDPNRLGGDIDLKHVPIMKVKTDDPSLMKGTVYTRYTGTGWEEGIKSEPFNVGGESSQWGLAFSSGMPVTLSGENPLWSSTRTSTSKITLLTGGYTVFTVGRPESLLLKENTTRMFFNSRGEVFTRKILPRNQEYSVTSAHLYRSQDPSDVAALELSNKALVIDDYRKRLADVYLEVPSTLDDIVYELAHDIVGNTKSAYEKMLRLESWLKTSFNYTQTPGPVPDGADFVSYFLTTHNGYCTYYASTMAVMARILGVPSRFVLGYGLVQEGGGWMAYGDNAHAWVECYIPGAGWMTFDPTGGSSYMNPLGLVPAKPGDTPTPEITAAPTESRQEKATTTLPKVTPPTTSPASSISTTDPGKNEKPSGGFVIWLILSAVAVIVILAAVWVLRLMRRSYAYDPETVRRRFPDPGDAIDYYYTDILRLLSLMGICPEIGETALKYSIRANEQLDGKPPQVAEAFDAVMRWRYGLIPPDEASLNIVIETHDGLEKQLLQKMGRFKYFIRRFMFPGKGKRY